MWLLVKSFLGASWVPIAAVVGITALGTSIYVKGHSDGTAAGEDAQRQAIFDQLKQRNITDEKVQQMADPELCRAIGGVLTDNECH